MAAWRMRGWRIHRVRNLRNPRSKPFASGVSDQELRTVKPCAPTCASQCGFVSPPVDAARNVNLDRMKPMMNLNDAVEMGNALACRVPRPRGTHKGPLRRLVRKVNRTPV